MKNVMEYVEKALSRAQDMDVEYIVFGSGPAKSVPNGFPMEEGYSQIVTLLKQVNEAAKAKGITIVIEPLRKAECNLINTFKEGCQLARDTKGSNIKVLVDFYHLSVEEEPVSNLVSEGQTYLRHVHFANPKGRVYPENLEAGSYESFISALKAIGYDNRISCEAYTNNYDISAPKTLEFLRDKFD